MAATVIIASFEKPLIPCWGVTSPLTISAAITMSPTTSARTRSHMKRTSAPAVIASVSPTSNVNGGVSIGRQEG